MGSPVGGRNSLGTKRRGGLRRHSAQTLKPLVDGIWETESDRLARLPKGGRRKGRMLRKMGGGIEPLGKGLESVAIPRASNGDQ